MFYWICSFGSHSYLDSNCGFEAVESSTAQSWYINLFLLLIQIYINRFTVAERLLSLDLRKGRKIRVPRPQRKYPDEIVSGL